MNSVPGAAQPIDQVVVAGVNGLHTRRFVHTPLTYEVRHALVLNSVTAKVDENAKLQARRFQIGNQLGLIDR